LALPLEPEGKAIGGNAAFSGRPILERRSSAASEQQRLCENATSSSGPFLAGIPEAGKLHRGSFKRQQPDGRKASKAGVGLLFVVEFDLRFIFSGSLPALLWISSPIYHQSFPLTLVRDCRRLP